MTFRPLLAKSWRRDAKSAEGGGKLPEISEASEVLPSFLPVSTCHMDLWNCTHNSIVLPTMNNFTMNFLVNFLFAQF